jgi:hypothetical protein
VKVTDTDAVGGPMFGWDVNDPPPAVFPGPVGVSTMDPGYCVVVDDQSHIVAELPGVTGFGTSDYASCVAQVSSTSPMEFSFSGGKMGVLANVFGAGDNVQGESAGGVSPTWRITFLSRALERVSVTGQRFRSAAPVRRSRSRGARRGSACTRRRGRAP